MSAAHRLGRGRFRRGLSVRFFRPRPADTGAYGRHPRYNPPKRAKKLLSGRDFSRSSLMLASTKSWAGMARRR